MGPHLCRSIIHPVLLVLLEFWGRTYINRSSSYQFSSIWVFGIVPISIDHSSYFISSAWVFWDRTYIDHSFVLSVGVQFEFLGPHLYQSVIHLVSSVRVQDQTYIDRPSSYQFEFEFLGPHLYRSVIFLSICVQFELGPHLYRSVIFMSVQFGFWGHTYINRSSSYQFNSVWVLGPHLYQSVIFLLVQLEFRTAPILIGHSSCQFNFRDCTYINLSSSCRFESGFLRSHLYQSVIFLSVCVQFELELHLYRSVIVLLVWVFFFWVAPISISHLPISLCSVSVGTAPLLIDHHLVSLSLHFQDCTYIDRSS